MILLALSDRERRLLLEALATHLDVGPFASEDVAPLYDLKDRLEESQSQQDSLHPGAGLNKEPK